MGSIIRLCLNFGPGAIVRKDSQRCPARRGFTVAEILTALAIAAVLGALILPTVWSSIRESKKTRMAEDLTSIAQGVREFEKHVGVFPIDLDELSTKPVLNTDKNSCGVLLTQAQINAWRGPYLPKAPPFVQEEDTIFDYLTRKAGSLKNPDELQIAVQQPPMSTALALDSLFDGDANLTIGTITWNTNKGYPRMFYNMPVQGC